MDATRTAQAVDLATTLNDARRQASAFPHRYGIYDQTAAALEKVLVLILGADEAPRAYRALLAGHAVPEALAIARQTETTTTEAGTQ